MQVSGTQVIDVIEQGAGEHPATPALSTLEKRIEELGHRFVIERAVAEGAKRAIKALDHGKPLAEAQSILQESNEKLDLLKYSLEERVKELPDGHPRKSIATEEMFLDSVESKPIALTGTLKVRVKGCYNILENVPGRVKEPSVVLPGKRTRQRRLSLMSRIRRNNRVGSQKIQETVGFSNKVRAQLKIDQIPVGSTSWKTVSNPSWNETFKLELNKSRELELCLYWHDQRSLCATQTLKLEKFLVNRKQELCLQLEPQGTLFIKVTYSSPFIQKRPQLQTIRKFFSKKQKFSDYDEEVTIQPAPEEEAANDIFPLSELHIECLDTSLPAVDNDTEETIQSALEEDKISENLSLLVADIESVEPTPLAVHIDTEETIQSALEEDIISDSLSLLVADNESVEPTPLAVHIDTEETIQSALEEDIISATLSLLVADNESVEPSPPTVVTDTEETTQPSPAEDAQIEITTVTEETIEPAPEDLAIDPVPLPEADVKNLERTSSAGIHQGAWLSLQDFDCLSVLGRGQYGKVLLAEYKPTKTTVALKALKKKRLVAHDQIHRLIYEKNTFQTISSTQHPFLVNLLASFQTEDHVCFVMEYAAGGDLLNNINNNIELFDERTAVFYAACCVLGLEFLHKNNIAHRDLKMGNIVIDKDGYAKIADFGLSKHGMGYKDRTNTCCGTVECLAPEVLLREQYTRSIDWWSLGVIIYIMLVLQNPFSGDDHRQILYNIVYSEPDYPEYLSDEALSILTSFLNKNPKARLGARRNGARDVKKHPFFEEIDWIALLHKNVRPPIVPCIAGPEDVSNFDIDFTSQDPCLTPPDELLSKEEQDPFQDFDWVAEWM
ncbi:serine/threonine-protein kinase N2-like [Pelobates fuscus]|uniref:serine/threonine-protein kinase N2-like n=1 Tax=Pelobates fuscus TaxID=191477 RepID=UPI002FE4760D